MVFRRVDTFFQDIGNAIENDPNIQKAKSFIDKTSQSIEEKSFASGLKRLSKGDFKQLKSTMDTAQKLKEMGGKPHLAFKELLDKNPQLTNCKEFEDSKIKDTVDSLKKDIIKDSFSKFEGFDFKIGKALDRMSAEDGEMLLDKLQQMSSSDQRNCLQVFGALAYKDCSAQFLSEFTTQLDPQEMINLTKSIKTLEANRKKNESSILLGVAENLPKNNLQETLNSIKIIETLPSKQQQIMANRLNPNLLRSLQKVGENEQAILSEKFLGLKTSDQCRNISKNLATLTSEQLTLTAQNIKTLKSPEDLNYFILNLTDLKDDPTKQMAAALNKSEHKKVLLGILKQEKGQDRAVGFVNVLSKDFSSPVQNTLIEILQMPGSEKRAAKISEALSETYKDFNTRDKEVLAEVWAKNGTVAGENLASNLQELHKMAPQSINNEFLGEKLSTLSKDGLNCLTKGLRVLNPSEENAGAIAENLPKMQPENLKDFAQSIELLSVIAHSNPTAEQNFKKALAQSLAQLDPDSMNTLTSGIKYSLCCAAGSEQKAVLSAAQEGIYSLLDDMAERTPDQKNSLVYWMQARIGTGADAVTELSLLNTKNLDELYQILENGGDGPVGVEAFTQLDAKSALSLAENTKNYSKKQTEALKAYFSNPNKETATNYMKSMMQLSSRAIFADVALTDAQKNDLKACMESKKEPTTFSKNALAFLGGIKDLSTQKQNERATNLELDDKQKTLLLNWKLDPSPANAQAFLGDLKDEQIKNAKSSPLKRGKSNFDKAQVAGGGKDEKANKFMELIATPHPLSKARLSSDQKELAVEYLKRTENDKAVAAYSLMETLTKSSAFIESAIEQHADFNILANLVMQLAPKDAVKLRDFSFSEQGARLLSEKLSHNHDGSATAELAKKIKTGGADALREEIKDLVDTENAKIAREAEEAKRAAEKAAKKLQEEKDKTLLSQQAQSNSHRQHLIFNQRNGAAPINKSGTVSDAYNRKLNLVADAQKKLAKELYSLTPPARYKEDKVPSDGEKCIEIMEKKKSSSRDTAVAHFKNAGIKVQQAKQQLEELIQSWQQVEAQNQAIVNSLVFPGVAMVGQSLGNAAVDSKQMKIVEDAYTEANGNTTKMKEILKGQGMNMTEDQISAALLGWDRAKMSLENAKNFLKNMFTSLQKLKGQAANDCWKYCSALAAVLRDVVPGGDFLQLGYAELPGNIEKAFAKHAKDLPEGTVGVYTTYDPPQFSYLDMSKFQNAIQSLYNEALATAKQSRDIINMMQETSSKLHK